MGDDREFLGLGKLPEGRELARIRLRQWIRLLPKSGIFNRTDFHTEESVVDYLLSYPAAWIVEELGVPEFLRIVKAQSEVYRKTAA